MTTRKRAAARARAALAAAAAAASLAALAGAAAPAGADPLGESACPDRVVLAVDGTKDVGALTSESAASALNPIADRWESPGAVVLHVEYPGGMVAGVNGWTDSYDDSVARGEAALRSAVRSWSEQCPSAEVVLLGYSQGARIAGDVASEIDRSGDSALARRTRLVAYADPRQSPDGVEVRLAGRRVAPGVTLTGPRPPFRHVRGEWHCATGPGDGVCGDAPARDPLWGLEGLEGYVEWHAHYATDTNVAVTYQGGER